MQYPQLLGAVESEGYIPRIFGFRVHNQRGAVSKSAGDSRGLYATAITVAPQVARTGATTRTRSSADDVALSSSGARASLSKSTRQSVRQSPGEPKREEVTGTAGVEAYSLPIQPVASSNVPALPGTPATLAPFVYPVEGMPGGVPVYAAPTLEVFPAGRLSAVVAARSQGSAGSTPGVGSTVVRDGVSYLIMRPNGKPMTSCAVPGGPKDDFSDDEEETVVQTDTGGNKRKRKT